MNKHLQDYFNAAKQQQPILSSSELQQLIKQTRFTQNKFHFSTLWPVPFVLMGCLLVGLWWALPPATITNQQTYNKPKSPKIHTHLKTNPATQQMPATNLSGLKPTKSAITSQRQLFDSVSQTNLTSINQPLVAGEPLSSIIYNLETLESEAYISPEGYLVLNHQELADLGIFTDGQILNYLVQTDSFQTIKWDKKTTREAFMFSINIEKHGSTRMDKISGDSLKLKDTKPFWPLAFKQGRKNEKTTLTIIDQFFNKGYELDYFNEAKPNLIPVYVFLKAKEGKFSHDNELVFWFKNEPEFIANLPSDAQQECLKKFGPPKNNAYFLTLRNKYRNMAVSTYNTKGFDSISVAIFKKNYIKLADKELKKLKITKRGKTLRVNFYDVDSNRNKTKLVYHKVWYKYRNNFTDIHYGRISLKSKRRATELLAISPIAVSDYNISTIKFLRHYQDSIGPFINNPSYTKFKTLIPNLYPIYVDSSHIFWIEKNQHTYQIIQASNHKNAGIKLQKQYLHTLITLTNIHAKTVKVISTPNSRFIGKNEFMFNINTLTQGVYCFR